MKDLEYLLECIEEGVDGYAKDMDEDYISATVRIKYRDGHAEAEICETPKRPASHGK